MAEVVARIRGHLDDDQKTGLGVVLGGAVRQREDEALACVRWVDTEGPRVGVRVATVEERVRSTGREGYLLALGLPARRLFDVVGNHFDPDAVIMRMMGALREWAEGARYRCEVPSPAALLRNYEGISRWVVQQQALPGGWVGPRHVPVAHPFPEDLRPWLLAASGAGVGVQMADVGGSVTGCSGGGAGGAAEDGRGTV